MRAMKVLVMGAGIAGVTTAYELYRDGHEVTVIDREEMPASLTSYANAGLFAPGHSYAWSSPSAPRVLLKSLWRNDQALRLRLNFDKHFLHWMWRFLSECTAERAARNTSRKARLCNYSLEVFHQTLQNTNVKYDGRGGGLLYLYRNEKVLAGAAIKSKILVDNGCKIEALDREAMAAKDPALEPVKHQFAGALFAKNDESGDCRLFARNMAKWLAERGVEFKNGLDIKSMEAAGDKITAVVTGTGTATADLYVLCLGVYSPHLSRSIRQDLPIYPVKGYSVTFPVSGRNNPPAIGGVDEENLIAYCPLGDRLRVTATAEFSGYGREHSPDDFRHMLKQITTLFPDGADYSQPDYWAGLRPMTPEGTPILGRGRHDNLWYNTGLGHMGWTMSHATARITADLIAGRGAAIPLDGMTVRR
jgi:D-amino-acid dehydrogenase